MFHIAQIGSDFHVQVFFLGSFRPSKTLNSWQSRDGDNVPVFRDREKTAGVRASQHTWPLFCGRSVSCFPYAPSHRAVDGDLVGGIRRGRRQGFSRALNTPLTVAQRSTPA
jgi:hypothetical protein